jgi:Ca-activated chloride channel family protein
VKRRSPSRRRAAAAWFLVVAAGATSLAAQQAFRGGTELVGLTITVHDGNNRLVAGLDEEDFQVFEDNVRQDISNFSRQPQPTALSIVIDTSVSMEPRLGVAQSAAVGFVRRLGANDLAQVLSFDSTTRILIEFTQDKDALERAIRRTEASGSTSLYNALYTSLRALTQIRQERGPDIRRQAIVLLSDGQDTTSVIPYEDVLDLAKRSEVVIYAIALQDKPDGTGRNESAWKENQYVLGQLTASTGGRAFSVTDPTALPAIYAQIADELSNQYTIGYASKSTRRDGAWRRIVVRVTRPNMTARTKAGYFGPSAR